MLPPQAKSGAFVRERKYHFVIETPAVRFIEGVDQIRRRDEYAREFFEPLEKQVLHLMVHPLDRAAGAVHSSSEELVAFV